MIDNTRLSTGLLEPQSPQIQTKSIVLIVKEITSLTVQTFFGYFCLQLMNAVSLHVLSKKGSNIQVAGYGFANLISSMLILPIGFGINQSLNQDKQYCFETKTDLFADLVPTMMITEHYQLYLGFIKQTIPQVTHVLINDVGFLTLTIIAMRLGTDEFNAQLAFNNISTMYFRIPCSLALTLMSCISKELGASNIKNAKNYFKSGISLLLGFQILLIFSIIMYKDMWTKFYAANSRVYNIIQATLPVFVFGCFIFDGLQCALSGVLKGLNHGQLVSNLTLYCYLGIGIPGSMILANAFNLGIPGLWIGFGFANFILMIFFLHQIYYVDWSQKSKQIQFNQEDMNNKYLDKEWEMKVLSE
ncbi:hypothetical protein pb186bvf_013968 [Paramecium bursaria]